MNTAHLSFSDTLFYVCWILTGIYRDCGSTIDDPARDRTVIDSRFIMQICLTTFFAKRRNFGS